jgi:hypothetical protein
MTLQLAWKQPVDASTVRVAVADTVGGADPRLVCLCKPESGPSKIIVLRWLNGAFAQEWSTDLPEAAKTFAVGRFDAAVPMAEIVTGRSWFGWDGAKYAKHDMTKSAQPAGIVLRRDGTAILLTRDKDDFGAYTLDSKAGSEALVRKDSLPDDGQSFFGCVYASPADLETQVPPNCATTGLFAFWDVQSTGRPARLVGQFVPKGQEPGWYAVLAAAISPKAVVPLWRSPALDGRLLDVAYGDPKSGGAPAMTVLHASADGKGKVLSVFALVKAAPSSPGAPGAASP